MKGYVSIHDLRVSLKRDADSDLKCKCCKQPLYHIEEIIDIAETLNFSYIGSLFDKYILRR